MSNITLHKSERDTDIKSHKVKSTSFQKEVMARLVHLFKENKHAHDDISLANVDLSADELRALAKRMKSLWRAIPRTASLLPNKRVTTAQLANRSLQFISGDIIVHNGHEITLFCTEDHLLANALALFATDDNLGFVHTALIQEDGAMVYGKLTKNGALGRVNGIFRKNKPKKKSKSANKKEVVLDKAEEPTEHKGNGPSKGQVIG